MRQVLLFLVSLVWIGTGCDRSENPKTADANRNQVPSAAAAGDELAVGEPIKYSNLTIFPISSRTPKNANRFVTLDAGLKAGTVEVMEVGTEQTSTPPANVGSPDVNLLLVLNRADKPLYLMPGEIIIGGQQDRAIGHEYVITPNEKPVPIDVFCVEHGRWQDRVPLETAAIFDVANSSSPVAQSVVLAGGATNLSQVVQQSTSGKFLGSVGNVSKSARLALQSEKSQGAVWDRVAQTNQSSGLRAPSGAFTGNYIEPSAIEQLEPYIKALNGPIVEHPRIVGALVAINGQVETMDIFESTPLFLALWPKLLKSYALDAANAPEKDASQPCSCDQARQFLAKATATRSQVDSTDENLVVTTRSTADFICFSAQERTNTSRVEGPTTGAFGGMGGQMGGGMGGFGGSVHTSGFSK